MPFELLSNLVRDGAQMLGVWVAKFVRDPVGVMFGGVKHCVTVPFTFLVDALGDENSIINTATGIFKEADNNSRGRLIDEVLRRSPGLIKPETLLEAGQSFICGTISEHIKIRPITSLTHDVIMCSVELAGSAVDLVQPDVLLKTVKNITRAILNAFVTTVGELPLIRDIIFSNDINAATLGLIWSNGAELASFFVDLAECTKCYVPNTSRDGAAVQNEKHGEDNELDFSKTMNRHAAICQLQRLAYSIIFILKGMTKSVDIRTRDDSKPIGMTAATTLNSDAQSEPIITVRLEEVLEERPVARPTKQPVKDVGKKAGKPAAVPSEGEANTPSVNKENGYEEEKSDEAQTKQTDGIPGDQQPKKTQKVTNEKWLFVNGIAGEYHWTRLACKKLAKKYLRDLTGIFNRGDGILWDLVECAGERSARGEGTARSQKQLIKRTESSREAQAVLEEELKKALNGNDEHIVMIAHSQGCLLLRLALEKLIKDPNFRRKMMRWLCVFTFGNPSVDWKVDDGVETRSPILAGDCGVFEGVAEEGETGGKCYRHLSAYTLRTEHFANSRDFVAKLGVLSESRPTDSGYDCVFINKNNDWIGHFFGSQYSLSAEDYEPESGQTSWLLACEGGNSMADVKSGLF
jgi:hypothetical protein